MLTWWNGCCGETVFKYNDIVQVYTDVLKDPNSGRTVPTVYIPQFEKTIKQRTLDHLTVYTVELLAILLTLAWIEDF